MLTEKNLSLALSFSGEGTGKVPHLQLGCSINID
jgi:hypothetical protein